MLLRQFRPLWIPRNLRGFYGGGLAASILHSGGSEPTPVPVKAEAGSKLHSPGDFFQGISTTGNDGGLQGKTGDTAPVSW